MVVPVRPDGGRQLAEEGAQHGGVREELTLCLDSLQPLLGMAQLLDQGLHLVVRRPLRELHAAQLVPGSNKTFPGNPDTSSKCWS